MLAAKNIAIYKQLRKQPHWRLLAADLGPIVIALLQKHFMENERSIPSSVFHERIQQDIENLRASGEDIPQTAQAYIADWLAQGYLQRHFPAGATEEVYELSLAAATAIRFVTSLVERRTAATESRLAAVIHQLTRLAEESDPNPQTRMAALIAERERIDREIEAVQQGRVKPLPDNTALERAREIIALTDGLLGDFHRVRDEFEHLNRDLRRQIMDYDGSRGTLLDALFAGVDVISNSDAGRTFSAFWRLLTDPEQNTSLEAALEQIITRGFSAQMDVRERRFLRQITRTLLDQSGSVHDVLQHFARSLKHFVQSREYLEHRRLNQLLKEAQRTALTAKDNNNLSYTPIYSLMLSSCKLRSLSQWSLYDPSLYTTDKKMQAADASVINLEMVSDLIAQSEIDFRNLKGNILVMLQEQSQVTIANLLERFPAAQGLGTVIGYIALGSRYGHVAKQYEFINWAGNDDIHRRAQIPLIYFLRDRQHELR